MTTSATSPASLPAFDPATGALPAGDYYPTQADFEARFVHVTSTTRLAIHEGATRHASDLATAGVPGQAPCLLNGSYTTNKVDPGDIDLVVEVDEALYLASPVVQTLLAGPAVKSTHHCDAYPIVVLPAGHPDYKAVTEDARTFWHTFFGKDRANRAKGRVWRTVAGFR